MKKKFVSYLTRLKFDPSLLNTFHARYLKNVRLVILLISTIIALGASALSILPRRLNPEVKLTIVTVVTALPGAGPGDIESLITVPLEDKLKSAKGIDTITSTSKDNVSVIAMQFKSGVDKDKARNDVERAVSEVSTLPSEAQPPKIEALDFEDAPIWNFALTGNADTASLMRFADSLSAKIKNMPNVDRVVTSGEEKEEIQINITPEKLKNFGLNPWQFSSLIKAATNSFPAGSVTTDEKSFAFSLDAQALNTQDLRNLQISVANQSVKLGDIAQIYQKSRDNQKKSYLAKPDLAGKRAVTFAVYKVSSADIDKTVKEVEKKVREIIDASSGEYQLTTIENTGELIGKQFTDLFGEFQSTLILVFINLLVFLGARQALIASITIPLTFLMSFVWMSILGQTINFITLFSLLLAFGTSIDDTIVTVSAMTSYFRTGKFTPLETGLLVWRDLVIPIWTTTVTTVWAFLPLILTSGIIGEFIKPIPIVVATTMYTSTFIAWFITLPMIVVLLKLQIPRRVRFFLKIILGIIILLIILYLIPRTFLFIPTFVISVLLVIVTLKVHHDLKVKAVYIYKRWKTIKTLILFLRNIFNQGLINIEIFGQKYQRIILRILHSQRGRRVALICLICFALTSYLLVPLGMVKNEFFPKTNEDTLYLTIEYPSGTNLKTVETEAKILLEDLRKNKESTSVTAQPGVQIGGNGNFSDSESSLVFTIRLKEAQKRKLTSDKIAEELRKIYGNYTKGQVSVVEVSGGPPAGADLQIKYLGENLSALSVYADKTVEFLKKEPGVINTKKSVKEGLSKIVFIPDPSMLAQNNISYDTLGFWMRLTTSGFNLDKVKFGTVNEEDITFYTKNTSISPEEIFNISVPGINGNFVPLTSLGQFKLEYNPTIIYHEGGKRMISVTAGVSAGYSISDLNKKLENFAVNNLKLESGYEWKTGGVNEENQKSVVSIFRAMALSFILIMATMVVEFRSYRQAAMILSLIPLAISGVFIIFGLTGTPLTFPSLIGVMALFGVVVTNAMFIVEKINQNRTKGMDLTHAIADAGQSRLEPIMLTSLTSILGLVPITIANPLWRGLGGAIIAGLMFSGGIMLIYIPVVYYYLYRSEK